MQVGFSATLSRLLPLQLGIRTLSVHYLKLN